MTDQAPEPRTPAEIVQAINAQIESGRLRMGQLEGTCGVIARYCLTESGISLSSSDALLLVRAALTRPPSERPVAPENIKNGMSIKFTVTSDGKRDVWLNFVSAEDGKSCSLSVAALAERSGHIIGAALRGWASDRINEHLAEKIGEEESAQEKHDNSQFGVGA